MDTTTPRFKKLFVGGVALLALGVGLPAQAGPEGPGRPEPGSVGNARFVADPKGQRDVDGQPDGNRGFTCDENKGVGGGSNPARAPPCEMPTDGAPTDGAPTDGAPTDGAPTDGAPTVVDPAPGNGPKNDTPYVTPTT